MAYIFALLKRWLLYQIILLPILLIVCNATQAQVYLKAKSLTTQDSLSDNRITCFYKDKTGFVWIGTRNGLNRYDGHRIITYKPTAGNSVSNEIINDIAEDKQGNIWVATMNGLNKFNPLTNQWEVMLPKAEVSNDDIPSNLIWDIDIDLKGRIWIASDVREFSCYDPARKKFSFYNWPAFVKTDPHFSFGNYNSIKRFAWKNEREVWLASNKALVLLNIESGVFTYVAGNYRSDVYDLQYDAKARKVYWTIQGGRLLSWDESTAHFSDGKPLPEPYPSTSYNLPDDNERWLASENGLVKIAPNGLIGMLSNHIPELRGSLQPGNVSAVLHDNNGVQWVGTANGVSIYDVAGAKSYFIPLVRTSDRESINGMGGVYFDPQRDTYFVCATDSSAVFLVQRQTGRVQKLTADADGAPFFRCNTIKADNENNIWLLTENNVYQFDDRRNAFVRFSMPNNGEAVVFRDMVQDAEGNYWFGSFNNGLYYYRSKERRFEKLTAQGFDQILTVTALHADQHQKKVWIGGFSLGFYCYDLQRKKLTTFGESKEHPEYAALDLVQDIAQDKTGTVWAATQSGGLFRFMEANGQYRIDHHHMRTGLPDNSFLSLAASEDSTLWALSGNGIGSLRLDGQFLSQFTGPQYFGFSSYLSDPRYPHQIFYNSQNKELLVGVGGGLLILPAGTDQPLPRIPLVITGISVNHQLLPAADTGNGREITLSFGDNNLTFAFAMLYYGAREAVMLEYRLKGWENSWTNAANSYEAVYQNLSPGTYQFEVRAKDRKGNVLGYARSISFQIKPPFWQRWWAVTISAVLLASVIYLLVKRRITNIKKKAALQQQLAELEGKALRAQMNPHFIFNSLNAIQELVVTQNVDAAYNYLSKFSKLLRLVLNNSEKPVILLADEMHMLQLYLELESLRFRQAFHYSMKVDSTVDAESVLVPPLLLQPFIENALWHGLMLKDGEKNLQIVISREDEQLVCVIEDNGIGRKKAAEIKAQKIGASHFESKGLTLSRQRIELLKAKGEAGYVKIEDLYKSQEATGTRVSVHLPLIHV